MVSRKMLETMFSERSQAERKLLELQRHDTFQCCTTCNESLSYQAHTAHIRWLEEKIKLLDSLIDIYLTDQ
jgi:transcription initiation factor IIE alpha subunit